VRLPVTRIKQYPGKETILDCVITAFPQANNVWKKDGKELITSSRRLISVYDEGDNTLTLSLRLQEIDDEDYGEYTCEAANALGRAHKSMVLLSRSFQSISNSFRASSHAWRLSILSRPPPMPVSSDTVISIAVASLQKQICL
jgi:hypothetical protein